MNCIFVLLLCVSVTTTICENPNSWKHATIYQIFLASFKDSDGDGIGDLNGVTSKLDYLKDLSIDWVYLTPFFKCGQYYAGYDITNYVEIEPKFGTMDDFDRLIREMKQRKMNLIIDMVINHSGKQHDWYTKSQERNGKYTDYYVWANAKGSDQGQHIPPNNWQNVLGGSAWTWNDRRGQFYLHQFTSDQPDLNFRSQALKDDINQIIAFWIDKGISGIRLDAAQHLMEDDQLRDEPLINPHKQKIDSYNDLDHIYTTNIAETFHTLHDVRISTEDYTKKNNKPSCIILIECTTANNDQLKGYYGKPDYLISHFPYNFRLTGNDWYDAQQFHNRITEWIDQVVPPGAPPNWMLENHDCARVTNRYNEEYSSTLLTAIMTLPGIALLYYGQEIGISGFYPPNIDHDKSERLPMHWDNSLNAGFTTNRQPWLPVNPNYWRVNVANQTMQELSYLHMVQKLHRLRKTITLRYGDLKTYVISKWIYAFTRSSSSHQTFITVLNFGTNVETVGLRRTINDLPEQLKVAVASLNAAYKMNDVLSVTSDITMKSLSSLVLTTKL